MKLLEILLLITVYANQTYTGGQTNIPIATASAEVRVEPTIAPEDSRITRLREYFTNKHSPLVGTEQTFIEVADQYRLDWALLPAIAGVESGFERAGNTSDFNPFGYMCGGSPCVFESYEEGIRRTGRTIGEGRAYKKYRESGSLSELAPIYNVVSPEEWSNKITYFMDQIK